LDDRSVVEGREALCDAAPAAGRRMAAFGLKADFLFSILSVHCPAAVVFRCDLARGTRAVAHCLECARTVRWILGFGTMQSGWAWSVPGRYYGGFDGVWSERSGGLN